MHKIMLEILLAAKRLEILIAINFAIKNINRN